MTNPRDCKNALVIRCKEGVLFRDEPAIRTKFNTTLLEI